MPAKVVEEKFPLSHVPKIGLFVVVETDQKGGDEIELCPEVGEGIESSDSLDHTTNAEEASDVCEHRHAVHIEAESGMAEQLGDVEKISHAAAEVENTLPAHQIELDLANPSNVDADPAVKIEILRPMFARIFHSVPAANLLETGWVDCLNNALCLERKSIQTQNPERMFPCAR